MKWKPLPSLNALPSSKMTVTSTVVFGSPPGVVTLILSAAATTTAVASRLPNLTVTPPRPGWKPLPRMTTSSPPAYVPCGGSTPVTFRSFEHAAIENITAAAHTILTTRINRSSKSNVLGKLPRGADFRNHWNKRPPPPVSRSMATAVLLLTAFLGAAAVRILGLSSIDLLDDDDR